MPCCSWQDAQAAQAAFATMAWLTLSHVQVDGQVNLKEGGDEELEIRRCPIAAGRMLRLHSPPQHGSHCISHVQADGRVVLEEGGDEELEIGGGTITALEMTGLRMPPQHGSP